ncbi:hypothetical protein ACQKND_15590 [Viridibacillus arvi]|uniref:hypothetical protein n=1 Tax=Viridibacillus arvi TaxID=263475 RepID=UPI003D08C4D7
MNFKTSTTLLTTAILGVSLLTSPIASLAQEGASPDVSVVNVLDENPKIPYDKAINKTIYKDTVLKYDFEVARAKDVVTIGTLNAPNSTDSLTVKDKLSVVITDSTGKVVSTESFNNFLGVEMSITNTHLEKGIYTVEIKGLSEIDATGVELNFILKDNTKIKPKITDIAIEKKGVLPQGISNKMQPIVNDKNVDYQVSYKYPGTKTYRIVDYYANDESVHEFWSEKIGEHSVKFTIKNSQGVTSSKTIKVNVVKAQKPTKAKLKLSKTTAKKGQKVTLTVSAKGNNLFYKSEYRVKDRKYPVTIQSYSKYKTIVFRAPLKKGTYTVTAFVKQDNGDEVTKTQKVILKVK